MDLPAVGDVIEQEGAALEEHQDEVAAARIREEFEKNVR